MLLILLQLTGWPILIFALLRYHWRVSARWSYRIAITSVPLALAVAIGSSDYIYGLQVRGMSTTAALRACLIIAGLPYAIGAACFATYTLRKSRDSAAT